MKVKQKRPIICKAQRGVTLLEIIIGMAISVIIGVLITGFVGQLSEFGQRFNRTLIGQQYAQQTLQIMIPEIRSAAQSNIGNYPVEEAATSTFTFYADIDKDAVFERIRYFYTPTSTTFKKGVVEPTGNPLVYDTSTEVIVPLMEKMSMGTTSIFTYYDSSATSTDASPLPSPVDVLEVKTVKVQLLFDEGTASTPVIKGAANQATIRNLRFKENNEQF